MTKVGDRIRLVHTSDTYTNLRPGDEGTVDWVDDIGTTFVDWDNGSSLGLIRGEDIWEVILLAGEDRRENVE